MKTKLLAIVMLLFAAASVQAQVIPGGLNAGDQFRYVFITSTERDAISANIADYNAFVNSAAANNANIFNNPLLSTGFGFNAIASTSGPDPNNHVDAIDNTGTNAGGVDVPIFLLDGTQVATGNADLWDGSISAAINVDESLNTGVNESVWTGSFTNGTSGGSFGLGQSTSPFISRVGFSSFTNGIWILDNTDAVGNNNHLYGLSDPITVLAVPEPAVPSLLAFVSMSVLGLRRRTA